MNDGIQAIGELEINIGRADGTIEKIVVDNLVVTVGRNHIADQLSGQLEASMTHMAIGTGTTSQVIGDTALETELSRKTFSGKSQGSGADSNKVIYTAEWSPGEGTGAIAEAGIFNSAAAGVMLTRTTFPVKNKGAGDSLSIQWTLTISG